MCGLAIKIDAVLDKKKKTLNDRYTWQIRFVVYLCGSPCYE